MGSLTSLLLAYAEVDHRLAAHLPPPLQRLKLSRAISFDDDALHALAEQRGRSDPFVGSLEDARHWKPCSKPFWGRSGRRFPKRVVDFGGFCGPWLRRSAENVVRRSC